MSVRFSSVVPIRRQGSAPPLFFVHGIGGLLPDIGRLLDKLDPAHPVYGIQAQALDPVNPAFSNLEEIAAYDLEEIRKAVPRGPYCFIGYSFGGNVAYEIAQQLVAQGEQAPFIAMIDSCETTYLRWTLKEDPAVRKVTDICRRLKLRFSEALQHPETLSYVAGKIQSRAFRLLYYLFSGLGMSIPHALQNPYHVNWLAAVNYISKPYDGRVTLFKVKDHCWDQRIPPDLGWGAVVRKGLDVFEIPGNHVSLFVEPNVSLLGEHLVRCLEAVSRQPDSMIDPASPAIFAGSAFDSPAG